MNNYKIGQYARQYKESSITISPYIMKKIGIIKNMSLLRIDDYKLACVPYSISLSSCRLLLILSSNEQTIITGNQSGNMMLHLEFHHPNLDKEIPLFFRVNLKKFQQLNSRLNQCLLEVDLITVPQDYKEILIEYFLREEESLGIFNDPGKNSIYYKTEELLKYRCQKQGRLRISNDQKLDCRIIKTSVRKLTLYIDTEKEILENAQEKVIVELVIDSAPVYIKASIQDFTASTEVEGYFIVILNMEYSNCLVDRLSKIQQTEKTTEKSETAGDALPSESSPESSPEISAESSTDGEEAEDVIMEDPS